MRFIHLTEKNYGQVLLFYEVAMCSDNVKQKYENFNSIEVKI